MADDFRRIFASDSGTGNDGGAPPLRIQPVTAGDSGVGYEGSAQTWDVQLVTEAVQRTAAFTADAIIEAAPKSPEQAARDLAALTGGGWVGSMVWQITGQRGWFGPLVGGIIGVVWFRRRPRG